MILLLPIMEKMLLVARLWISTITAVLLCVSPSACAFAGYRSNFIGVSNNVVDTARKSSPTTRCRHQLLMNLPGQVSKKVIVTGAGACY